MNRIYRLVWNDVTQSPVAVAETAKGRGKHGGRRVMSSCLLCLFFGLPLFARGATTNGAPAPVPPTTATPSTISPTTLPTNGQVTAGKAGIAPPVQGADGSVTLNIDQSSPRATINWGTFNLGNNATVNFNQPGAGAATLNRVQSGEPSQIFGKINAPGQVFLLNASGILFGTTAQINVGGLTATSYHLSDADFMAGRLALARMGAAGSVINQGHIGTAIAGYAALLAPEVRNEGIILARGGTVALASGDAIALQFEGSRLIDLQITPSTLAGLVANRHAILAPDGLIILAAKAVPGLATGAIQNSGVIDASSAVDKGGRIVLEANAIQLQSGSQLLANGPMGGGTVLVGGDWQGSNGGKSPMLQATTVTLDEGAVIQANATQKGDGGKVVLWSDVHNASGGTAAHGSIQAIAGPEGGNGGQVETSGHRVDIDGLHVNAGVPPGQTHPGKSGQWLIDPYDYTINAAAATAITGSLNSGTSVTVDTSADVAGTGSNGVNTSAGNITVASNIVTGAMSADATLTLKAHNDIVVNPNVSIDATQGGNTKKLNVVFNSDQDGSGGGAIVLNTGSAIKSNGGNIALGGGTAGDGSGNAQGYSAAKHGLTLHPGTILNAAGGNIALNGAGYADAVCSNNCWGILTIASSISTTGSGSIIVNGVGGGNGGTTFNSGMQLTNGTTVTSIDGDISVTGKVIETGSGAGAIVLANNSSLTTSGSGNINLTQVGNLGFGFLAYGSTSTVNSDHNLIYTAKSFDPTTAQYTWSATNNITIQPNAVGGTVGVGSMGGTLAVGDLLLNKMSAPTFNFGSATSGLVAISTAHDFGNSQVNVRSGADISIGSLTKASGTGAANYTFKANGDIVQSGAVKATSGVINVTLNSDTDEIGGGAIALGSGAVIESNGGNIALGGGTAGDGSGNAVGNATNTVGVNLTTATVNAAGGNIAIRGTGYAGSGNYNNGVRQSGGSISTTGAGTITASGTGGAGTGASNTNVGVIVQAGGSITGGSAGATLVTGTGGSSQGNSNMGVQVTGANSKITSSGGAVSVTGTGGGTGASGYNYGVETDTSGQITSGGNGNVTVTGTGGESSGSNIYGVFLSGGTITSTSGAVSVTGTGKGTSAGYGVRVSSAGVISAGGTATVTVQGTGGSGTGNSNFGIYVTGANSKITSSGGEVSVTGTGGGTGASTTSIGVYVSTAGQITAGGGGNVSVMGTGGNAGGTGGGNLGVDVEGAGLISALGTGWTHVQGTGGGSSGTGNTGVLLIGTGSMVGSGGGDVSVSGTGGGSGASSANNYGVMVSSTGGAGITSGGNGNVNVSGIGGTGSGDFQLGVRVEGGSVSAAGTGTVTVHGTGGANGGYGNYGVYVSGGSSTITSSGGAVSVTGQGNGSAGSKNANHGIYVNGAGAAITSGGNADVTVTGTGGGAGVSAGNIGVYVSTAGQITAGGGGNVSVMGTGGNAGGTGGGNLGVDVEGAGLISALGTGWTHVQGTGGGSSGASNSGVLLTGAGSTVGSGGGDVSVSGTGGGSGTSAFNAGVSISSAGAGITSGGNGNVSVIGTGGSGSGGRQYGVWLQSAGGITASGMGTVTVEGTGGASSGVNNFGVNVSDANSKITSSGGAVSVTGRGGGGMGAGNFGLVLGNSGAISSGGNADITLTTDSHVGDGSESINAGTGTVTIRNRSAGTLVNLGGADVLSGSPLTLGLSSAELNRITAGQVIVGRNDASASGNITVSSAVSPTGAANVTLLTGGDIAINAGLGATTQLTLTAGNGSSVSGSGNITAPNLLLNGPNVNYTLNTAAGNSVGTLAAANAAGLAFANGGALTIGSVNGVNGISASGPVSVATAAGNLSLSQPVNTTDNSASAIALNAGQSTAAGTSTGGDIVVSGAGAVSTGAGGRATLMTGSVAGSTGVAALAGGSGSGHYRYHSDESTTHYTSALGAGTYVVYREAPTLAVTVNNDSKTYDATAYSGGNGYTATGMLNGDSAASASPTTYGGTAQGAKNANTYTLTAGGDSPLGYLINATNGTLTIDKADLAITTGNVTKTYDGGTVAVGSAVATGGTSLKGSDTLSGGSYAYTDKNAGTGNKTVTVTGVTVNDGNGGNYNVSYQNNTTSTIDKADLTLSGTQVYNGGTAFAGSNLTATGVGGESFGVTGSGASGNLASKNVQTNQSLASVTGLSLGASSNGGLASNYNTLGATGSSVSVTPANLTLTTSDVTKVYDGGTVAVGSAVATGGTSLKGSDTLSGGSYAYTDKNAGTGNKTVTVTGVTVNDGNSGGNYNVTYASNTTSTIDKADLRLTGRKTHDGSTAMPGATLTATGVAGETFSVTGAGASGNLATANPQTDQPLLNVSGLSLGVSQNGGLSSNYTALSPVGSSVTVTSRSATVPEFFTPPPAQIAPFPPGAPASGGATGVAGSVAGSPVAIAINDGNGGNGGAGATDARRVPAGSPAVLGLRQAVDDNASADSGFQSVLRFDPFKFPSGALFEMRLPDDTFMHSDPAQSIRLVARQIDGRPLPSWLRFDPKTQVFSGQPPQTAATVLELIVIARDRRGHEASTRVTLVFGASVH